MNNKTNNREKTIKFCLIPMFSAIGAITSWISIPMPIAIPVTLQTFGMALIGYVLGAYSGTISVAIYILLGAIGLPVFSGFIGGFSKIVGPTGGFIIGFLFFAFLCGLSEIKIIKNIKSKTVKATFSILLGIGGLILCHLCGVIQFTFTNTNGFGFAECATLASLPYLPKDVISVIAAYFLAIYIRKLIKTIAKI